jgi:plasmid maintenance system antidote protein VapI
MSRTFTDAHPLLDAVKDFLDIKRDNDLAERLKVRGSCISKIRHGTNKISALLILRIHLATDVPVRELLEYCDEEGLSI